MNRLSSEHLVKWRALYLTTQANFNRGTISEYACDAFFDGFEFQRYCIGSRIAGISTGEIEMATTKRKNRVKHGIRAPRKPKGESDKVTIANQDRQIKLLIDRCAELERQRNATLGNMDAVVNYDHDADQILHSTEAAYTRLLGWQDCVREILGMMYSSAPGV